MPTALSEIEAARAMLPSRFHGQESMKILHVIKTLDPATGGPPVTAVRLAAAQASLGHKVDLLSYQGSGIEHQIQESCAGVPGVHRLGFHQLPQAGLAERLFAGNARRKLKDLLSGECLLHLHGVWDPILKVAAAEANRQGLAYVVTPHGMLDPWSLRQRAWKKKLALSLGYRGMLNRAAFLHVLNADEKNLVGPLRLRCPAEVIPNGIFLEELPEALPADRSFRDKLGIGDRSMVLFLSRLHYKKGLDHLAAAFGLLANRMPDVRLVVAGPDGGARDAFEREIGTRGLQDRVHVVGPLYGRDKFAALNAADCFCLPSRQEGFSIAVLEALVCQLPVVVSESCHFPEVAEVGAGLVAALEPESIAGALQKVLNTPDAKSTMGLAGRKLVETRYTWPRIAERCLAAYASHCRIGFPKGT